MNTGRNKTIKATDIYQAIERSKSGQFEKGLEKISLRDNPLTFVGENGLQAAQDLIIELTKLDFDYSYTKDGKTVLIKDLRNQDPHDLDPLHKYEPLIQGLRYLRGMLLIQENAQNTMSEAQRLYFAQAIEKEFSDYQSKLILAPEKMDQYNVDLVRNFTALLTLQHGDASEAAEQLTLARDLSLMLEDHADKCTVNVDKSTNKLSIEISSNFKISSDFYRRTVYAPQDKIWFSDALKKCGLEGKTNWLTNFFVNEANYQALVEKGCPAPPSARVLPLPANVQNVSTYTADISAPLQGYTSNFIRIATPTSYKISDVAEQKRLAELQLREVIDQTLPLAQENFKERYKNILSSSDLAQTHFFVSYQQLLSPIRLQKIFYPLWEDNNEAFVEITKNVIENIRADTVEVHHTNTAINEWAVVSREYSQHRLSQEAKLAATTAILNAIISKAYGHKHQQVETLDESAMEVLAHDFLLNKDLGSEDLRQELALRLRASFYFRKLLNEQKPYNKLRKYQKNIMSVALETHLMGSQALNLTGCKSARDRTAVYAAAVKTMQQNPAAMFNWKTLNAGIILSLKEGHHFRSMLYHVGVVKVGAVQAAFSKTLEKFSAKIAERARYTKVIKNNKEGKKIISLSDDPIFAREQGFLRTTLASISGLLAQKWREMKEGLGLETAPIIETDFMHSMENVLEHRRSPESGKKQYTTNLGSHHRFKE